MSAGAIGPSGSGSSSNPDMNSPEEAPMPMMPKPAVIVDFNMAMLAGDSEYQFAEAQAPPASTRIDSNVAEVPSETASSQAPLNDTNNIEETLLPPTDERYPLAVAPAGSNSGSQDSAMTAKRILWRSSANSKPCY